MDLDTRAEINREMNALVSCARAMEAAQYATPARRLDAVTAAVIAYAAQGRALNRVLDRVTFFSV